MMTVEKDYSVKDIIAVSEAAVHKQTTPSTLYRWIKEGRLNTVEISGRIYIIKDENYVKIKPMPMGPSVTRQRIEELEQELADRDREIKELKSKACSNGYSRELREE